MSIRSACKQNATILSLESFGNYNLPVSLDYYVGQLNTPDNQFRA